MEIDIHDVPLDELRAFANVILENTQMEIQLVHKDRKPRQLEKEQDHFIDQLRDCRELKKEVASLRTEMCNLKEQLTAWTSALGAREMASNLERDLIKFIWSECLSKPFHIYSLKNLKRFLLNPETACASAICGQQAAKLFSSKPKDEQELICARMKIAESFLPLATIDMLKNIGNDAIADFENGDQPYVAEALGDLLNAKKEFANLAM
jgi:hypothetical protein